MELEEKQHKEDRTKAPIKSLNAFSHWGRISTFWLFYMLFFLQAIGPHAAFAQNLQKSALPINKGLHVLVLCSYGYTLPA